MVTPVQERAPAARSGEDADQPLFIEFVNTLHWYEGVPIELLGELPALNAWLSEVDLPRVESEAARRGLHALRQHLRVVVEAMARAQPLDPKELAVMQRALSRPPAHLVLFDPASDSPHLGVEVRGDPGAAAAFRIALSFATFLETGERKRLKLCANPGCGFAFVDTSMNMTRRWCFMRYCGNRVKVRTFRSRRRTTPVDAAEA